VPQCGGDLGMAVRDRDAIAVEVAEALRSARRIE
jgi:hypothetical protein